MTDQKIFKWDFLVEHAPPIARDYIDRLHTIPQSANWHPEGNVEIHTKIVLMRATWFKDNHLVLAALFHDLGKVDTTQPNGKGGYSAHGHEDVSAQLVAHHAEWIRSLGCNADKVEWIVKQHMRVKYLDEMKQKKKMELVSHMWFPSLCDFKSCDDMTSLDGAEILAVGGNIFRFWFNRIKTRIQKR